MCSIPLPRTWTPAVSLVMPCRNESSTIARAVGSLLAQDYPGPMELLVVDGRSSDRTLDALAGLGPSGNHLVVRVIHNPAATTSVGLNLGIAASRGEVIFTLGAHTSYSPNYVSGAVATLARENCDAVGSRAHTLAGGLSRMARAIALALSCPFGVGNSRMRTTPAGAGRTVADTASCPAYRRRVFERIGLFDPRLDRNQDIEFNLRLRRAGMTLVLDPEITSHYEARATLHELAGNCFGNGYWVVRSLRFCRRAFSVRHLVPFLFVIGAAATLAWAAFLSGPGRTRWLIPAVAAGSYVTAGIASLLNAHGRQAMPEALIVFPLMHCSYGLGSLWALITIWRPDPDRPAVGSSA